MDNVIYTTVIVKAYTIPTGETSLVHFSINAASDSFPVDRFPNGNIKSENMCVMSIEPPILEANDIISFIEASDDYMDEKNNIDLTILSLSTPVFVQEAALVDISGNVPEGTPEGE